MDEIINKTIGINAPFTFEKRRSFMQHPIKIVFRIFIGITKSA
jgi:hypothetical protein